MTKKREDLGSMIPPVRRIRNAFDRESVGLCCDPEMGRTQQHFRSECDINLIVDRWVKTGQVTHLNTAKAVYGDFSGVEEFQDLLERLDAAQAAFDDLPANIRDRFGNDPARLVEFCSNPENGDEAVRLGLAEPRTGTHSNLVTTGPSDTPGSGEGQSPVSTSPPGGQSNEATTPIESKEVPKDVP